MPSPKRILIMGNPGSGKTTVAGRIAEKRGLRHSELDAIHWQADWQMLDLEEFRRRVAEITVKDSWVIDGNYSKVRDLVLVRAETLIFLKTSLIVSIFRLLVRSLRRAILQEELWAGNRENILKTFFTRDSLILYALRTHKRRLQQFNAMRENPKFHDIHFLQFRSQKEIDDWIAAL